jgi:hypothetical protein
MPRHSLFPNSITINYTSNGHSHKQVLPVGVVAGSAPGWTLPVRSGPAVDWRTAVEEYAALYADIFDTGATIDDAELYTYEATDGPAEFLALHPLGIPGGAVAAPIDWAQVVFPFKAIGGTSLRLTAIETVLPVDVKESYAAISSAPVCALLDYILSADDFIITRGGTFPLVSLGMTSKINDKLRKRYLLD